MGGGGLRGAGGRAAGLLGCWQARGWRQRHPRGARNTPPPGSPPPPPLAPGRVPLCCPFMVLLLPGSPFPATAACPRPKGPPHTHHTHTPLPPAWTIITIFIPPASSSGPVQHLHAGPGRQPARPPGGHQGHAQVSGRAGGSVGGWVGTFMQSSVVLLVGSLVGRMATAWLQAYACVCSAQGARTSLTGPPQGVLPARRVRFLCRRDTLAEPNQRALLAAQGPRRPGCQPGLHAVYPYAMDNAICME